MSVKVGEAWCRLEAANEPRLLAATSCLCGDLMRIGAKSFFFVAVLMAVSQSSLADQSFDAFGAGQQSCGVWLAHPSTQDVNHIAMGSWVDGYLSAWNEARMRRAASRT